jgi:hypothetical protein
MNKNTKTVYAKLLVGLLTIVIYLAVITCLGAGLGFLAFRFFGVVQPLWVWMLTWFVLTSSFGGVRSLTTKP